MKASFTGSFLGLLPIFCMTVSCISPDRRFKGRETGEFVSSERVSLEPAADQYEIAISGTDERKMSVLFKVERISRAVQTKRVTRKRLLVYEVHQIGPNKVDIIKTEKIEDSELERSFENQNIEVGRAPLASGMLEVGLLGDGGKPLIIRATVVNGSAEILVPRDVIETIATNPCPGSKGRGGCGDATLEARVETSKVEIKLPLAGFKEQLAREAQQRAADETLARLTKAAATGASHVIQGTRGCDKDLDGSFICKSGLICLIDADLAARRAYAQVDFNKCDIHGRSSKDFVFVPASDRESEGQNLYWPVAVRRGTNTILTNHFGARFPAAVWIEVSEPRGQAKKLSR